MRHIALILMLSTAHADTGIDGVFVLSNDLGYEDHGFGLQLDSDSRSGDWGHDLTVTALSHPKYGADGHRLQVIGFARRFFGDLFIEAGAEYGGYKSEFPDGTTWTKYGYAPGVGIGTTQHGEFSLRYFLPDSTPNETSVIALSAEFPLAPNWTVGGTLERWQFDQGGERWSGNQLTVELGWRF